jgi:hypothetical protein
MSIEEVASVLSANNKKKQEQLELNRMGWYYSLIAPGMSKVQEPKDLVVFEWEKAGKKIEGNKYSKEELKRKEEEAKRWLETNR